MWFAEYFVSNDRAAMLLKEFLKTCVINGEGDMTAGWFTEIALFF